MHQIKMIKEEGLHKDKHDKIRTTARAIVLNDDKQVLMLYSKLFDDYTFPGGGVKDLEDIKVGLKREMIEETGFEVDIIKPYARTYELRYGTRGGDDVYLQESHYYLCEVTGNTSKAPTEMEVLQNLSNVFISPQDAINHNNLVHTDEKHQVKGLKTVLLRDNQVLEYLKGDIKNEKI